MKPSPQLASFEDYKAFVKIRDENQKKLLPLMQEAMKDSGYNFDKTKEHLKKYQEPVMKIREAVRDARDRYFSEYRPSPKEDVILLNKEFDAWGAMSWPDFPRAFFNLTAATALIRSDANDYTSEVENILKEIEQIQKEVSRLFLAGKLVLNPGNPLPLAGKLYKPTVRFLEKVVRTISDTADQYGISNKARMVRAVKEMSAESDIEKEIQSEISKELEKANPVPFTSYEAAGAGFFEKLVKEVRSHRRFAQNLDSMLENRKIRAEEIAKGFSGRKPSQAMKQGREQLQRAVNEHTELQRFVQEPDELADEMMKAYSKVCDEYDKSTRDLRENLLFNDIWNKNFVKVLFRTTEYKMELFLDNLENAIDKEREEINKRWREFFVEVNKILKESEKKERNG